jgi:SAM-dependent methyltransferase
VAPGSPTDPHDPYSRLDYRRLIAWPERLQREAPFLESIAGKGPEPSILDLGCGSGEHSRFFAERGYRVLGLDVSESQIRLAREGPLPPSLRFEVGDMAALEKCTRERFGTALTLGNSLVHLLDSEALAAACDGVHQALLPGGAWLVQILNFERLRARNERALPVTVRPGEGEEIVFLRLLRALPGGMMEFVPVTLTLRPAADPPVQVVSSHVVRHRGWTREELASALERAGFAVVEWFGDMRGARFDALNSSDLVFVARRA